MNKTVSLLAVVAALSMLLTRALAVSTSSRDGGPESGRYGIHWTCTPITPYERFACFAYRDDTGEIIATRQSAVRDKDLGMPVGARP